MSLKGRVFVGMSGGVDSSVAAALLKDQGYEVIGVFIRAWDPSTSSGQAQPGFPCTWREDRRDAMRVASRLNIPFTTINLEQEYKQSVVDYMINEYRAGRTPNPDVMCNKQIKFGYFYERARAAGADFVATGHYARVQNSRLLKSKDQEKDQTYFLWNLKAEQMPHLLFPIGDYLKSEVRELATKFKLFTASKKDSQGLCFIGKLDIKEFLKNYIEEKPGEVEDTDGRVIGRHEGVFFYTLGERHGFTITAQSPDEKPYYIVAKDIERNRLIVSHQPKQGDMLRQAELEQVNWISGAPKSGNKYAARARYREPLTDCRLSYGDRTIIEFSTAKLLPSGQSVVVYDGDTCLGGGVIA